MDMDFTTSSANESAHADLPIQEVESISSSLSHKRKRDNLDTDDDDDDDAKDSTVESEQIDPSTTDTITPTPLTKKLRPMTKSVKRERVLGAGMKWPWCKLLAKFQNAMPKHYSVFDETDESIPLPQDLIDKLEGEIQLHSIEPRS
jgi:hypothetical protein